MQPIRLTTTEAITYVALFNMGLGILFGAVPLILGFIKKERSYAVFGFLGAIIGGALLGIFLSIPVAGIFTWLILRRPKNKTVETAAVPENPVDVKVEDSQNQ
jgi:membrane associated rhomboid family serine protease